MKMRGVSNATRQHFRRDGRAKRGYGSQAEARAAANLSRETVYECGFCNQWHRGTKPGYR